jgi:hypothetical protein
MSDQRKRRRAMNEAVFREINEAIERGAWPGEESAQGAFRCECAERGCNKLVPIAPRAYEQVRAHARRFILLPGHEDQAVETVVEREGGYVVVEKHGDAALVAEATDPRT